MLYFDAFKHAKVTSGTCRPLGNFHRPRRRLWFKKGPARKGKMNKKDRRANEYGEDKVGGDGTANSADSRNLDSKADYHTYELLSKRQTGHFHFHETGDDLFEITQ